VCALVTNGLGVAVIDEFTLAGGNWPGLRALEIREQTAFQTYVAYRKDATLSSYCQRFVASLRGHMERLVEETGKRETVPSRGRRAPRKK
jgi:DNA-binding transcriptional LysR family regulator